MPVLRRADRLRLSLIPSLLAARQHNEALANPVIELFEVAKVYLPSEHADHLPLEEVMIGLVSGGDYFALKGVIEGLVSLLSPCATVAVDPAAQTLLDGQRSAELRLTGPNVAGERLGILGELTPAARKQFDLRSAVTIAELRLAPLLVAAQLVPQSQPLSAFPAVTRDVNLVVDEAVLWADVERTVRRVAAPYAEQLRFQQEYRDANRLGAGKKSLLFTLSLRSTSGTLTSEEADAVRQRIVAACAAEHGAQLRAG
jgi:phenylalanyl-tRNA synthetase beta chain